MEIGDRVVFALDPLLYGVMRIGIKTADGRFVCEPVHPSVHPSRRRPEVFFGNELASFTDPLVDVHAERAKLEERDTEKAQDADADARKSNTDGPWAGEGTGSE